MYKTHLSNTTKIGFYFLNIWITKFLILERSISLVLTLLFCYQTYWSCETLPLRFLSPHLYGTTTNDFNYSGLTKTSSVYSMCFENYCFFSMTSIKEGEGCISTVVDFYDKGAQFPIWKRVGTMRMTVKVQSPNSFIET